MTVSDCTGIWAAITKSNRTTTIVDAIGLRKWTTIETDPLLLTVVGGHYKYQQTS
jgi:hypothetical protein